MPMIFVNTYSTMLNQVIYACCNHVIHLHERQFWMLRIQQRTT